MPVRLAECVCVHKIRKGDADSMGPFLTRERVGGQTRCEVREEKATKADGKCSFVLRGSPKNKSQQKSISSLVTRRQRHSKGVKENYGNGRTVVYFSPKRVAAPARSITARQTMKFIRGARTNSVLMSPSPRTSRYNNRGSENVHTGCTRSSLPHPTTGHFLPPVRRP